MAGVGQGVREISSPPLPPRCPTPPRIRTGQGNPPKNCSQVGANVVLFLRNYKCEIVLFSFFLLFVCFLFFVCFNSFFFFLVYVYGYWLPCSGASIELGFPVELHNTHWFILVPEVKKRRKIITVLKPIYTGVSSNAFISNVFASNDPCVALSRLQSNDPKFRSNGNYSGHPGSNFKLPADCWICATSRRPSLPPQPLPPLSSLSMRERY